MISDFLSGFFKRKEPANEAHHIKNQIASEMLEVQRRLEETNRYIKKTTAYRIAKATGRLKQ